MADVRNDPSMEDILASIKRIIADDTAAAMDTSRPRARAAARPAAAPSAPAASGDEVLELTEQVVTGTSPAPDESPVPPMSDTPGAWPAFAAAGEPELISPATAEASRQAFTALASRVTQPAPGGDHPLEGLVREMLRPMLKEWLDARLPELVEGVVQREIARIAGRTL